MARATRTDQAYCSRSAFRRWTVTCGGAFVATAVEAPQSSSPVDGPVARGGRRGRAGGEDECARRERRREADDRRRARSEHDRQARAARRSGHARGRDREREGAVADPLRRWLPAVAQPPVEASEGRDAGRLQPKAADDEAPLEPAAGGLGGQEDARESGAAGLRARARGGGEHRGDDGDDDGDVSGLHGGFSTYWRP